MPGRRWLPTVVAFLATFVAFVACCAPVRRTTTNDAQWPHGPTLLLRGHSVTLPDSVAPADSRTVARLLRAVETHLDAAESDEKARVAPLAIGVTDLTAISCWDDPRPIYAGCWCSTFDGKGLEVLGATVVAERRAERRTILVVRGPLDELPALYHELHHDLWGGGHAPADRWARVDARGAELALLLRIRNATGQ